MDEMAAGAELARVLGAFTRMNIRLPRPARYSFTTLSVLHNLASNGRQRVGDLATREQLTQPALSALVRRLEADGLVTRCVDPLDRRAVLVEITPAGRQVIATRQRDRIEQLDDLLDRVDPGDRRLITAALPALARLVDLHDASLR